MKKLIFLCFILLIFKHCSSSFTSNHCYLTNITIVDVKNGKTLTDMTVVITDSIISAIGSSTEIKIPTNANVFNCDGKFIIPGLWDMHVHLGNATGYSLPLFVVNGITGIRDMGTKSFDSIVQWRNRIYSDLITGPRIVSSGPILNGGNALPDYQIAVNTAGYAKQIVDSLASLGVDFIKVHGGLSRETYYAIADECLKLNIPFAGHIPASGATVAISGEEAAEAGQRSLEHMLGIPFARDTIEAFQNMYPTEESLKHLFSVLLKYGTNVTPTLSVYAIPPDYSAISQRQDSLLKYISPELISFWNSQTGDWPKRDKWFMNWLLNARANMVLPLIKAGIPILAGTDTGFPYVLPGFGLHDELRYLVAAGLSPLEALKAATVNPAIFFGKQNKLGTVETGKLADLVILNADPTQNIEHLRLIDMVIVNGKIYDRRALDNELINVANLISRQQ